MDSFYIFGIDIAPFVQGAIDHWSMFLNPTQRMFLLYMFVAFVLAGFVWVRARPANAPRGFRSFLGWLFDPAIYGHKSSRQDYIFFLVNGLIFYGIAVQFLASSKPLAVLVNGALTNHFGAPSEPLLNSVTSKVLFTLCYALLFDFALFITHYWQHKISWLWSFHRVHHSAEVMTPITVLRMHPVDVLYASAAVTVLTGMGYGLFIYLSGQFVQGYQILGLNIFVFAFYFFGYNLRHSHVWLQYPVWLSNILVSPAQHQIHHSINPKHMDKNMGFIFAFWDKMLGTLYVPREKEDIIFGISKKERNPFPSVRAMFIEPFRHAAQVFAQAYQKKRAEGVLDALKISGTFTVLFIAIYFGQIVPFDRVLSPPPSVHMEDLTWTEIKQAMNRGYDVAIIPTAGTEQNGPHMVLGKHKYVVHETTDRIAKALGRAFVAPVMTYVPEGDISPKPTGHMQFAGTITLPEKVFEDNLYWAASSLKSHGFKYIFFIGDSGGNQEGQQRVAERLTKEWKKDGVIVAHIGDYYKNNFQVNWLMDKGYTLQQIGTHAAIRDTSEMLAAHPQGVRHGARIVNMMPSGVDGDPSKASRRIGKVMIELKVKAALKQINDVTKGKVHANDMQSIETKGRAE